jgi:hypothetical protein
MKKFQSFLPTMKNVVKSEEKLNLEIKQIKLNKLKNEICVSFQNENHFKFSSEFLRVYSPSIESTGSFFDEKLVFFNEIKLISSSTKRKMLKSLELKMLETMQSEFHLMTNMTLEFTVSLIFMN